MLYAIKVYTCHLKNSVDVSISTSAIGGSYHLLLLMLPLLFLSVTSYWETWWVRRLEKMCSTFLSREVAKVIQGESDTGLEHRWKKKKIQRKSVLVMNHCSSWILVLSSPDVQLETRRKSASVKKISMFSFLFHLGQQRYKLESQHQLVNYCTSYFPFTWRICRSIDCSYLNVNINTKTKYLRAEICSLLSAAVSQLNIWNLK